jgi:hypothetical protein
MEQQQGTDPKRIEAALRKAHEAGDVEGAKKLAAAYKQATQKVAPAATQQPQQPSPPPFLAAPPAGTGQGPTSTPSTGVGGFVGGVSGPSAPGGGTASDLYATPLTGGITAPQAPSLQRSVGVEQGAPLERQDPTRPSPAQQFATEQKVKSAEFDAKKATLDIYHRARSEKARLRDESERLMAMQDQFKPGTPQWDAHQKKMGATLDQMAYAAKREKELSEYAEEEMQAIVSGVVGKKADSLSMERSGAGMVADPAKIQAEVDRISEQYGMRGGLAGLETYGDEFRRNLYNRLKQEVDLAPKRKRAEELFRKEADILLEREGIRFKEGFKADAEIKQQTESRIAGIKAEVEAAMKQDNEQLLAGANEVYATLTAPIKGAEARLEQAAVQINQQIQLGAIPYEQGVQMLEKAQQEYAAAYEQYKKDWETTADDLLKKSSALASRYNQRYQEQQRAILDAANKDIAAAAEVYAKEFKADPMLQERMKAAYEGAWAQVVGSKELGVKGEDEERLEGTEEARRLAMKQISPVAAAMDVFTRNTITGLGGAFKGISTTIGFDGGYQLGEEMERAFYMPQPKSKEVSDLLDPMNFAALSGQLLGAMAPSLAASIGTAYATGGTGAPVAVSMVTTALAGWGAETMDIAGRAKDQMLAKTGSMDKANEAWEKSLKSQVQLLPAYAFDGLPFVGKALKGVPTVVGRVSVGAGVEYVTETFQEIPQNIAERNILAGKEAWDDFAEGLMDPENKEVLIAMAPIALLGGGGQITSQSAKKEFAQAVKGYIGKGEVAKHIEGAESQWLAQMTVERGDKFAHAVLASLHQGGHINEQQLAKLEELRIKAMEHRGNAIDAGLNDREAGVYTAFSAIADDLRAKAENSTNPIEQMLAKARLSEIEGTLKNFVLDKEADYVTVTYPDGKTSIMDAASAKRMLQSEGFLRRASLLGLTKDGIQISGNGAESAMIVDQFAEQLSSINDQVANINTDPATAPTTVEEVSQKVDGAVRESAQGQEAPKGTPDTPAPTAEWEGKAVTPKLQTTPATQPSETPVAVAPQEEAQAEVVVKTDEDLQPASDNVRTFVDTPTSMTPTQDGEVETLPTDATDQQVAGVVEEGDSVPAVDTPAPPPQEAPTPPAKKPAPAPTEAVAEEGVRPLRYDPSTNRHSGEKLVRGDVFTDDQGSRYALDRDQGYMLSVTKIDDNNKPVGAFSISVDPTDKARYVPLTPSGENIYAAPASEKTVNQAEGVSPEVKAEIAGIVKLAYNNLNNLAGPANKKYRQRILELLTGTKPPVAKAGINAVEEALFKASGVPGGSSAAMRDGVIEWLGSRDEAYKKSLELTTQEKEVAQEANIDEDEAKQAKLGTPRRTRKSRVAVEAVEGQAADAGTTSDPTAAEEVLEAAQAAEDVILSGAEPSKSFSEKYGVDEAAIANELNESPTHTLYSAYEMASGREFTMDEAADIVFTGDFLSAIAEQGITLKVKSKVMLPGGNPVKVRFEPKPPKKTKAPLDIAISVTANDKLRPVLETVHIDGDMMVATDAHKLVVLPRPSDAELIKRMVEAYYASMKKTYPSFTRDQAQKNIEQKLADGIDGKNLNLLTGDVVEGKFPNYKAVIPENRTHEAVVPIEEFAVQIEGAARALSNVQKGSIRGIALDIRIDGETSRVYVNPDIIAPVVEALRAAGNTTISIQAKEANRAVVMKGDKAGMGLAMPIEVREGVSGALTTPILLEAQPIGSAKKAPKAPEGEKKPTPKKPATPKAEEAPQAPKPQEAKPISEKAKAIADKLRQGKLGNKGLKSTIPGFEQAWDTAVEAAAVTIELTGDAAQAISDAIKAFKATDWYKSATQAERDKREVEVSDYVADITSEKPKATKPKEDKDEPKQVKKTFTTVRAYEGDFREEVKAELKKSGLYRNIENQEEAEASADAFIKKVGVDAALEAVREGDIRGGAATVIRVRALEALDLQYMEAETQQDIEAISLKMADLIQENSRAFTEKGQESAMLDRMYKTSDVGFYSDKKAQEWEKEFGEAPSEEMMAEWRKRDEELREVRKQLDEAIKRAEEAEEKAAVEAIKESVTKEKQKPRTYTRKAKDLAEQFRKLKAAPMTFKDADGNIIRVNEMGGGWNELVELGAKVIEKTGQLADGIAAIAEQLREQGWFSSLDDRNKAAVMQQIEDHFRTINEEDLDGRIRIPKRMIREAVEAGANDINTLVAVVKEQLKAEYPDATDREIRDAITEYGKVVNMNQDEISAKIRRMRDIGRTISAIEDVEQKKRPLRSGLQRDKLNAEQRGLKKKLRELMKDLPLDTETQQRELKTALDAAKTRTQNRIEDLQREIEMRERVRKNNKILTPDRELQDLIARKEELQKEHDAIFKDKAMTQEERLEAAVASARRSLDEVQRKIRERDLDPQKPTPITPNEELLGLREQLEEARAEYNRLRDEEGIILRNRLATAKAMTKNRIADLQKRLDEKDFAPRKRKDPVEDTELTTLKAKQMRLRERYDKEFYKYRLTQRTPAERAKDAFWQGWSFARAINASFEISFVLIQGGAMTISNMWRKPATVARAMKNMWRAFASETKSDVWLMRVKAQDWYPVAKKAKLAITEPHAELSAREESFFSDWTRMAWSMLGSPLLAVSVKAHTRWVAANPMRALERAASAYLDTLRVERFLDAIEVAKKNGKELTEKDLKDMADVINTLTGRGSLGRFEQNSDTLAKVFYSPRLWSASMKTATPYGLHHFGLIPFPVKNPQTGKIEIGTTSGISPTARKMALQDMGRFVGTTMGFVAMAALYLNGDDDDETGVELDPRSSDFMKIKIGDTRIDPWGGRIQQVVFTTKIVLGMLSIARDEPFLAHKNKKGELMPLGVDYKSPTTFDVALQMAMNKLAPSASLLVESTRTKIRTDKSTGEQVRLSPYGEEFNLGDETLERLTPIYWQTVNEMVQDDPGVFEGFALLYAFLGGGVGVQKPTEKWKPGRNSLYTPPPPPKRQQQVFIVK